MKTKITTIRRPPPLTEIELRFVDAYLQTGDAKLACESLNIPVANGPVLLSKREVKRALEESVGFRPAQEMDVVALLEEILTVSRDAAKAESYMAALTGYRLFHTIKSAIPDAEALADPETERLDIQRRAKAISS